MPVLNIGSDTVAPISPHPIPGDARNGIVVRRHASGGWDRSWEYLAPSTTRLVRPQRKMTSPTEYQCIAKAREVKLRVAQEALADFVVKGVPFKSLVSECAVKIDWSNSLVGKVMQIALLPIIFVLVLLGVLLTPIAYVEHLREVAKKKSALREKIQRLSTETRSFDVPDNKNLAALWRLHGLEGQGYSSDTRLDLLCGWVDILYGSGSSEAHRLRERVHEFIPQRVTDGLAYVDIPCILFVPPVDCLIRKLTEELPTYT